MANNYDPAYEYKNNEFYKEYEKQKEELKKKYPPEIFYPQIASGKNKEQIEQLKNDYIQNQQPIHRQYLKEVADLLFEPSGYYQQFIWDTMAEVDKLEMERKARGRANRGYGQSEEYY